MCATTSWQGFYFISKSFITPDLLCNLRTFFSSIKDSPGPGTHIMVSFADDSSHAWSLSGYLNLKSTGRKGSLIWPCTSDLCGIGTPHLLPLSEAQPEAHLINEAPVLSTLTIHVTVQGDVCWEAAAGESHDRLWCPPQSSGAG